MKAFGKKSYKKKSFATKYIKPIFKTAATTTKVAIPAAAVIGGLTVAKKLFQK